MSGIRARMLVASALLALIVGGVFAGLLLSIGELQGAGARARHSEEVLASANGVEKLVLDVETGQRGYVITRNAAFLEPWRRATTLLPAQTRALEALVDDNPSQQRRARQLSSAIVAYVDRYSRPLVAASRNDPQAAARVVASGAGKVRVDAIRAQFAAFGAEEQRLAAERRHRADGAANRAIAFGAGGLAVSLLLVLLFALWLSNTIVTPVRRLAAASTRLARGELTIRVPVEGDDELTELARSFNAAAESLEESRDELESQNSELELQTLELEDQQDRLSVTNDELQAQQAELERALAELEDERQRLHTLYEFGQSLASDTDIVNLSALVLTQLSDFAAAEIGALYVIDGANEGHLTLAASRGMDRTRLPDVLTAGEGAAGRALAEGRRIMATYPNGTMRFRSFGEEFAIQQELHVPLVHGNRVIGVASLGRVSTAAFSDTELSDVDRLAAHADGVDHLARHAAVALANAASFTQAVRNAAINSAVLDATTDAIALVGTDGRIILGNRSLQQLNDDLVGHSRGDTLEDVLADRTADPDAFRAQQAAIAADPEAESLDEYTVDGRCIQRHTKPVQSAEGLPIGRIFVLRDVTAERRAERLKTELVATVSHELRTPLTSVLGFSELLLNDRVDAATRETYIGWIHDEARRLSKLVNDFLDLQRIESGTFELSLAPFDLAPVLSEQIEQAAEGTDSHDLTLNLTGEPLIALGEADRLREVVANLLSNATKYSPHGGSIEVSGMRRNGSIRISVSDEGLGIPADQHDQLFTKFFRVDTSDTRTIGGTGLGLALCREIVHAHGGEIGFESAEGTGSTFWFEVPAAR
jgi:signal transduction histidine kinase